MLKFLRKVRKSMINSGQTQKYIVYAVGEIFLVMIGIILALQVNNWNEQRKQKRVTENYLTTLMYDLKDNLVQIETKDIRILERIEKVNNIKSIINSKDANIDSLKFIAEKKLDFRIVTYNAFNNNTYQTLKNTGHLEFMHKRIQKNLQEMQFLEEDLINVSQGSRDNYDDLMTSYQLKFPPSRHLNYSDELQNLSWENVSFSELLRHFEAIGWMEGAMYGSVRRRSDPLKRKYETLIDTMQIVYPFLNDIDNRSK